MSEACSDPSSLVGHAFLEQKASNLDWFLFWDSIDNQSLSPQQCKLEAAQRFELDWEATRTSQNKLKFYNSVKLGFGCEPYLSIDDEKARKALARIRSSAHDLRIETGRYAKKGHIPSLSDRTCRFCCTESSVTDLEDLPFFDPIIECESHAMTVCPAYHHFRMRLSDDLKIHLLLHEFAHIMHSSSLSKELGYFLSKSYYIRNPKKKKKNVDSLDKAKPR